MPTKKTETKEAVVVEEFPGEPDWTKPILGFEEVRKWMMYAVSTMKDWCRDHPDFCKAVGNGLFKIHRDGFIAWFASGRKD